MKILGGGAAAGAAGSVVSSPTELIRTKMQMVRKNNILAQIKGAAASGLNPEENYKGNWDCAKKIFRNHGLRGMYSGYLSTLLRDMQVGGVDGPRGSSGKEAGRGQAGASGGGTWRRDHGGRTRGARLVEGRAALCQHASASTSP